jgi:hypothetical protein
MASFVLEGLIESVLTDDGRQWLRDHVEFLAVPFMDKDGVEDGDQGKNRAPHDHNRDYRGESIYASVGALRELVPRWSEDKLRIAMDLHCPYIRGGRNETVFLVAPPGEQLWENLQRFASMLESLPPRGLPYEAKNNLPFGREWNTPERRGPGLSMSGWAAEIPGIQIATTLEVPYANASGTAVTPDSARVLGRDLARALSRYLQPPASTAPATGEFAVDRPAAE